MQPTGQQKFDIFKQREKNVVTRKDIGKLKPGDFVRVWSCMKNPNIFLLEIRSIITSDTGAQIRGRSPYVTSDGKLRWRLFWRSAYWDNENKVFRERSYTDPFDETMMSNTARRKKERRDKRDKRLRDKIMDDFKRKNGLVV